MYKKTLLSVFLTLSFISNADSRVIRCIDDDGKIYFTDSSCPRSKSDKLHEEINQPAVSGLIVNEKARDSGSLEFWCHSGKGKFIRC